MRMHTPKALKSTSLRLFEKAAYWVIKVTVWKAKGDMSGSVTFENVARRDKCEFNQGIRFKGSHVESFANPNFMCRNHFGCFIFAASGKVRILMAMRFELIKCSALAILPLVWRTDFGAKSYRHGAK